MNLDELRYAVNNPPKERSLMGVYEDVSAYAEALEVRVAELEAILDKRWVRMVEMRAELMVLEATIASEGGDSVSIRRLDPDTNMSGLPLMVPADDGGYVDYDDHVAEVNRHQANAEWWRDAHERATPAVFQGLRDIYEKEQARLGTRVRGLEAVLTRLYQAGEETVKHAASASDRKPWVDVLNELCNALIAARAAITTERKDDSDG